MRADAQSLPTPMDAPVRVPLVTCPFCTTQVSTGIAEDELCRTLDEETGMLLDEDTTTPLEDATEELTGTELEELGREDELTEEELGTEELEDGRLDEATMEELETELDDTEEEPVPQAMVTLLLAAKVL